MTLPADWAGAGDALEAAFPGNRDRIERFFRLLRDLAFWQIAAMRGMPADEIAPVLFRQGLRPLAEGRALVSGTALASRVCGDEPQLAAAEAHSRGRHRLPAARREPPQPPRIRPLIRT
ncbi:hypothetical protein Q3V23_36115 [Streptomyces sp. VNUA116]|uniref:hypothetical protein n=1 Tax=Streptomyces sp. VNUA116 TaxID=3062449 RepID=UPI002676CB17|nr:hypothetical protein [Streptomyces sp. VNUA116]WKU49059.1 hypothetical protein Q3V23_36115 [Streptomyces sp. VNUA116]